MKLINQYAEFLVPIDGETMLRQIELAGRACYKSEDKITPESAKKFCSNIIKSGHEAVLEHASFSVRFVTDRSVTHEIVRHRLAAYCQESQRYCNYSKDKFGNEVTFVKPVYLDVDIPAGEYLHVYGNWYYDSINPIDAESVSQVDPREFELDDESLTWTWATAMGLAEVHYLSLLNQGAKPEEARAVLPNSTKTELVMTADVREWRHFLKQRCDKAAHPQIRDLANQLLALCKDQIPILFDDIQL